MAQRRNRRARPLVGPSRTHARPRAYLHARRARPRPTGCRLPGAATERRGPRSCGYGAQDSRRDAVTNHLIQARALFGRCEARPPHGTGRQSGDGPGRAPPVTLDLALGEGIVLCQVHADQLRREVQHEGGVELAAVRGPARVLEVAGEVEREDVYGEDPCPSVRSVDSASWWGSWPCAVRIMKASTPHCSQAPSRSFIQRCKVLRRTAALPGYGRFVAVLTPYAMVGARSRPKPDERSSASRSTINVSQPSGRWGPCCSHVPTGTNRRESRARAARTASGVRTLRCSGKLTS